MGSTRAQYGKSFDFPHHCRVCHQTVSVDLMSEAPACPRCGSTNVISYEARTRRCSDSLERIVTPEMRSRLGLHRRLDEAGRAHCDMRPEPFILLNNGSTCPACLEDRLCFEADVWYD